MLRTERSPGAQKKTKRWRGESVGVGRRMFGVMDVFRYCGAAGAIQIRVLTPGFPSGPRHTNAALINSWRASCFVTCQKIAESFPASSTRCRNSFSGCT